MSGDFMSDHFTDQATITVRTQTGTNGLGEPVYAGSSRAVSGLLVMRPRQVWRTLGLASDVDGIFMTQDPCDDLEVPATLTVGGKVYRDVTKACRDNLWGDTITRLLLHGEAR